MSGHPFGPGGRFEDLERWIRKRITNENRVSNEDAKTRAVAFVVYVRSYMVDIMATERRGKFGRVIGGSPPSSPILYMKPSTVKVEVLTQDHKIELDRIENI